MYTEEEILENLFAVYKVHFREMSFYLTNKFSSIFLTVYVSAGNVNRLGWRSVSGLFQCIEDIKVGLEISCVEHNLSSVLALLFPLLVSLPFSLNIVST